MLLKGEFYGMWIISQQKKKELKKKLEKNKRPGSAVD